MRILPIDEHQQRKEKILQAVVHLYIKTGKPVGSNTILDSYSLSLSSASIRNVLAELEKDGYLTHPHTSAGRTPTDRGYRFYVNSIVNIQKLAAEEEKRIRVEYSRRMREIEDLMQSTTRVLSSLSNCTGFVLSPSVEVEKLRRVELIPVNESQVLAVLVSDTGVVRNRTIPVHHTPSDEALRAISALLNERLSGLSFNEAESRLLSELDRYNVEQSAREEFLQELSKNLFDGTPQADLYVEGASNILKFPEFQDYEAMRHFARLVDEKETLGQVLNKELNKQGLQVRIGLETSPELKNFSVVSSSYEMNGRLVGVLGILGPKRMEYERMMAIVNMVAQLVNRALNTHTPLLQDDVDE
jgi:heat-inducible transcriptional repressor